MPLNENFGDYMLLEQVGIGGMAEVYLARRTGMAGAKTAGATFG